jgi:hypothetical protein
MLRTRYVIQIIAYRTLAKAHLQHLAKGKPAHPGFVQMALQIPQKIYPFSFFSEIRHGLHENIISEFIDKKIP